MLRLRSSKHALPPGPRGLEVARLLLDIQSDTLNGFSRAVREWGDVVHFTVSRKYPIYIFSRPEHVQHVLQDNHKNYRKAVTYDALRPALGNGLLTSEGDLWLRERRLVAPMFHRRRIANFVGIMTRYTTELMDRWEDVADTDETIDVAADMAQLTLSIAGQVLFSRDIGKEASEIGESLVTLFHDVNQRITSLVSIPLAVPTPHNRKVNEALRALEKIVFGMIDERRGREDDYDDLLSMLMQARYEGSDEALSDRQIRDEVMTFMLAGHETTSNLLAWTLLLLSEHPVVRRRLEAAVDDELPEELDAAALGQAGFLEMVLDEALRLYPPAWTIERTPYEDDEIGGYVVPAGSVVVTAPYFVHHNPRVWDNPEGFDPERMAPQKKHGYHRFAHFPFGGGPRMCVGADFAMLEAKIALAMITRRFRLDLLPHHPIVKDATVTLRPGEGIRMTVHRR